MRYTLVPLLIVLAAVLTQAQTGPCADLDPAATSGLVEGGNEFYSVAGAFGLRDLLLDSSRVQSSLE